MRLIAILIFSILQLSISVEHDAVIALFNLTHTEEGLFLNITFDQQDYKSSVAEEGCTADMLNAYLNENTSWAINEKAIAIEVESIRLDQDHYKAKCKLNFDGGEIFSVKIWNTFLHQVDGHSNIIMIDANDTFKDYRMHAERTKIEVKY